MSKRRVGIDLGSTAVRVVEVSGVDSNNMPQVSAVATASMPPGAIIAGRIVEAPQVADAIRRAFASTRISKYGVVLGIASPAIALSRAEVPSAVLPHEWANVVRMQGIQLSPNVPMEDAILSVQKIDERPEAVTLAISAVLREEVESLMDLCRLAKITPRALDLAPAATFRGLVPVAANDAAGVSTLVDIGATKTTVATRQGTRLRSVRVIEIGGDAATRALMGALRTRAFEEAEALKYSLEIGESASGPAKSAAAKALAAMYGDLEETRVNSEEDQDTQEVARQAVTSAMDGVIEAIMTAIEADTARYPQNPTQSVLLAGRGSLLRGLPQRLQSRMDVSTFLPRPYIKVSSNAKTKSMFVDGTANAMKILEIVSAVGLATWSEDE